MKKNLPNILSWSRIVLSGAFVWLLIVDQPWAIVTASVVFIVAALTDYYDGYFARKYNANSAFGSFFDPLADKFLTTAAFIAFAVMNLIPFWMVFVVVLRDFGTTGLRIYFDKNKMKFQTSFAAKAKTMVQMVFISYVLLLMLWKSLAGNTVEEVSLYIVAWIPIWWGMLVVVILSVLTLLDYLRPIFKSKGVEDEKK